MTTNPATCPACGAPFQQVEPWWAQPAPRDDLATWGYLCKCPNHHFHFDTSRTPSPEEIRNRPGCRVYQHE